MRFPMTLGLAAKVITGLSAAILLVLLPVQVAVVLRVMPVGAGQVAALVTLLVVGGVLVGTVVLAPRAVRVEGHRVVVERLWWSDYVIPLRQVTEVRVGPPLQLLGKVWRVFGNGGLMGFTGLYHVRGMGTVRCWATRLNRPTVLLRRGKQRPVLLGVDDPRGLLTALQRAPR